MSGQLRIKGPDKEAAVRPLKNPLYDTTLLVHNTLTQRLQYFTNVQGQAIVAGGAQKTEADTNIKQPGQIGKPNYFEIYGFQTDIMFDGTGAADSVNVAQNMHLIYEGGAFEFNFGQQLPWLQAPLEQLPNGLHMDGDVCTADATNAISYAFVKNGDASCAEYYDFAINGEPVPIEYSETFSALITWPGGGITITTAATVGYRICVYLKGILYSSL